MKQKAWIRIIIVIAIIVVAIKLVPPVNDWARGNLPEPVLRLLGEEPKNIFERGADKLGDSLQKGKDLVNDVVDKVKN